MKKPHALITGIAGFAGSFLAEELLAHDYQVSGSILADESTKNIKNIQSDLKLLHLDIQNSHDCTKKIKLTNPDIIFHLAAFSSVGQSFQKESLTFKVNFEGTLNILNAALGIKRLSKVIYVSSAECYGTFNPKNKTLTEDQPFNPISPYAVSKAAAEFTCNYYARRHNLPVTIARSFNHTGPRQNDSFVVPSFAKQIAQIEIKKAKPVIFVGDLSAKRDFSDVRDVVRGYRLLAEKGVPGQAYHFCSGKAVSVKKILELLLKLSDKNITVRTDKSLLRKTDIPVLRGDNRKSINKLGYGPLRNLEITLRDTLDYWRETL